MARSTYLSILRGVFLLLCLLSSHALADVKITAINDLSLGTYSGTGDLSSEDEVCVYNSASQNYTITVTTTSGAFELRSGINPLPVQIRFKEGAGSYVDLSYGVAAAFGGADMISNSCGGSTNATLQVRALQSDLLAVRPSTYSTTLTLLISPN